MDNAKQNVRQYEGRKREAGVPVPSVGRIVHYAEEVFERGLSVGVVPRAALIVEVAFPGLWSSNLGLWVFVPSAVYYVHSAPYGGDLNPPRPGSWCWTQYVPPVHLQGVGMSGPDFHDEEPDGDANRELEPPDGTDGTDGMEDGEGISDGGRDAMEYQDSERAKTIARRQNVIEATPKGSVFAAEASAMQNLQAGRLFPNGPSTLELRERIMELQTALSAIFTEQPDWVAAGYQDISQRFESYVDTVRDTARKALGS